MAEQIDPIDTYFKQMLNSLCETLTPQQGHSINPEMIRQTINSFRELIWSYQKYLDSKNIFNSGDVIFDENTFK